MPDRVAAMTGDLFECLLKPADPNRRRSIYCTRDSHADDVAIALNKLLRALVRRAGPPPADPYAFKCTAAVQGADPLPDFRGAARHHFIARPSNC